MAANKRKGSVPPEVIAAARERATKAREQFKHRPRLEDTLTPEERADAAPFYFTLREFVRQLKEARLAADLTLDDVSARTGIATESLSRLETGANTNPTWKTLGTYAKAVGLQPRLTTERLAPGRGVRKSGEVLAPAAGVLEGNVRELPSDA